MMGNRLILLLFASVLAVLASFVVFPLAADAEDIPRVSGEYLERKLGSEGLVIVDARSGSDWRGSSSKIKGAIRGKAGKEKTWAADLPKDAEIVIYCA
ncbi:MAG: hypothetical protein PQJ28_02530 [Spirochaetales bacterium]|nr:hypothetical protein [Spirochaetales bacterium]